METVTYLQRKKYEKFDDDTFLVYLNEEVKENFVPESREGEESAEPCTAYAYTGPEKDGGNLIEAIYDDFVSGLVRLKFNQAKVEAILLNQGDGDDEHLAEYNALQLYRRECKELASRLLAD